MTSADKNKVIDISNKVRLDPPGQVQNVFRYGSYCDSALYEYGIIAQSKSTLIQNPVISQQVRGWSVGLAPWSETPLAIQFLVGVNTDDKKDGQRSTGVPQIVRPGEIIRPVGLRGCFSGIQYNLPFGWLGGGATSLMVFKTPDSVIDWNTARKEVMFHQFRIPLVASTASAPVPALRKNWPLRFPWANAFSGTKKIPVNGNQVINVSPTRTVFRLRNDNLISDLTVRLVLRDITDLDVGSDGLTTGADLTYTEFTFKANPLGFPGAGFPTFAMDMTQIGSIFGSQVGGISLVTDAASLAAQPGGAVEIDVCRYGTV